MGVKGPDSLGSWAIAVSCCFINAMMFGMSRLSGVLFVASMPRYNVDRGRASFPYTFANFIRNTSGPLVGYLGHRLGIRVVATFGGLLAAIGVGTCFLAENIFTVTLLWGTLFGLGYGLGNILLPVRINQYFEKYRATASGISFSGACLGSFILPPIVEILLATYGLSGSFLVLAGLVLHCVPAALILLEPEFVIKPPNCFINQKDNSLEDQAHRNTFCEKAGIYTVEGRDNFQVTDCEMPRIGKHLSSTCTANAPLTYEERMKRLPTHTLLSSDYSIQMSIPNPLEQEQILQGGRQLNQKSVDCEISRVASYKSDQSEVFDEDNILSSEKGVRSVVDCHSFTRKLSKSRNMDIPFKDFSVQYYKGSNNCSALPFSFKSSDMQYSKSLNDQNVYSSYQPDNYAGSEIKKSCELHKESSRSISVFSVLYDPIFVLVAVTNAIYCFTFVCMVTVIVDFSRDVGIGLTNEKYILMSLSVGDLVGRLGLGWLTDDGHMTRTGFAALCFLCQGLVTIAIAWSTGFVSLVILTALYGLSEAGLIVIFPLIVAEFIDEGKQTVAISSSHFLAGPLCLTIAPLIGYFRDGIGSYDYIFYGIGIISALCSVCWLLTTCLVKHRGKARKI